MKNRNIVVGIILSIVTCGIYAIYWFVKCTDEMNQVSPDDYTTSGIVAFLFTLITCGIYGIYWAYKMGLKLNAAQENPAANNQILFIVLELFGFNIVNLCLLQNEINKHVEF